MTEVAASIARRVPAWRRRRSSFNGHGRTLLGFFLGGLALLALPERAQAVTPPSFFVTCSAGSNSSKTCQFGFDSARVVLYKRLSSTACVQGSSWSSTSSAVTVRNGCSAEFKVDMKSERPHVIVLTDIGQDPDDHQSLIRTLLYSNDISLKAIIPTYRPGKPVGTDIVRSTIAAYDKDLSRLQEHDIRFPRGEILLKRLKPGLNYNNAIGAGRDSQGSNYIINVVDQAQVPVWVLVWGGSRELAQALYKVKSARSASAYAAFQKKLRVYTISWSQ
ncbi:MAG TPA: nucleoside hydrolase-like domain-containing protein, partial [Geminicoccus sp.]|uniref:nucleoside hydrolase-like domain-containing protein n=1 Tax=Geminicoccus sp. TaxID=2024832 RepID=UPI002E3488DA